MKNWVIAWVVLFAFLLAGCQLFPGYFLPWANRVAGASGDWEHVGTWVTPSPVYQWGPYWYFDFAVSPDQKVALAYVNDTGNFIEFYMKTENGGFENHSGGLYTSGLFINYMHLAFENQAGGNWVIAYTQNTNTHMQRFDISTMSWQYFISNTNNVNIDLLEGDTEIHFVGEDNAPGGAYSLYTPWDVTGSGWVFATSAPNHPFEANMVRNTADREVSFVAYDQASSIAYYYYLSNNLEIMYNMGYSFQEGDPTNANSFLVVNNFGKYTNFHSFIDTNNGSVLKFEKLHGEFYTANSNRTPIYAFDQEFNTLVSADAVYDYFKNRYYIIGADIDGNTQLYSFDFNASTPFKLGSKLPSPKPRVTRVKLAEPYIYVAIVQDDLHISIWRFKDG